MPNEGTELARNHPRMFRIEQGCPRMERGSEAPFCDERIIADALIHHRSVLTSRRLDSGVSGLDAHRPWAALAYVRLLG